MNTKLTARCIREAKACLADFRIADETFINDETAPVPNYMEWAARLANRLHDLLFDFDSLRAVVDDLAATLAVARDALLDDPQPARLDPDDLGTVLDALTTAAEHKRELADYCADCTGMPNSPLCLACTDRLADADRFDALADRLTGNGQ